MTRLAFFAIGAVLTAAVQSQCLAPTTGTSILGPGFVKWSSTAGYAATFDVDDEGISNPPIAFTAFTNFPMAGAVGNLDQMWINSNGEIYLTDSTLALLQPAGGALFGANSLAELRGIVGASARIVALGADSEGSDVSGSAWDIRVDQTIPGEVRITYVDMARFANVTDQFTFDCTLYSSGAVKYSYGTTIPVVAGRYVGISIGNAVGTTTSPSQDLTAGADSGTVGLLYENLATWDLTGRSIFIVPNGLGGYTSVLACEPAFHAAYGAGCYSYSVANVGQSFYELFPDSATAAAALNGNALLLAPTSPGYTAVWVPGGGTGFLPPVAATSLPAVDDGSTTITPSLPVPFPGGSSPTMTISHNGYLTFGSTANNGADYTPTGAELVGIGAQTRGVYGAWTDFNNADALSGPIQWEEVPVGPDTVLVITWNGVEGFGNGTNPSTWQYQVNLTTGVVTVVWTAFDAGVALNDVMVGFSDVGASPDPGSIVLSSALPLVTTPNITLNPLTLSAAPPPVIGGGGSSGPLVYTVSNVPDFIPPFGIGVTAIIFSVAGQIIPGGVELGGAAPLFIDIGAPGCFLHISSLDVILNPNNGGTTSPTASLTFTIPPPLTPGQSFYAQAVSFIPGLLVNGQNAFGGIFSNGVQSSFQLQ